MAVLHRDDGVQFALRPYRELLGFKKASLFKKELELLAQSHGQYIRLFPQPRGGYEAVFSREPGYLLGESVWRYLDKPNHLIYCEILPGKQEAIVVVVREGAIYLDAQLPQTELADELTTLLSSGEQFEIYTYGTVPLVLQERGVAVTQLPNSLFTVLPVDLDVQLLPYQRVIEELTPSRPYMAWIIGGIVLLAAVGWFMRAEVVEEEQQVAQVQDPWASYRTAFLGTSLPSDLNSLMRQIELLYGLPGWVPGTITYSPGSGAAVAVNSLGGTTGMLLAWAEQHKVNVNIGSQGAALTMQAQPDSTRDNKIPAVMSLQLVFSKVIDRMMSVLPGKSVTVGTIGSENVYKKAGITIQVNGIAPYVLSLIGAALDGLPVVLVNCALTLKDGLLSGTIELSALGS